MRISLISAKKQSYPTDPVTLGGHLKKRRFELELFQKEAAAKMEINEWTFLNWEHDRTEPPVHLWPRIIKFLSYYPSAPRSIGEQLFARRRCLGFRRKKMAELIGVDEATLAKWEKSEREPKGNHLILVRRFMSFA